MADPMVSTETVLEGWLMKQGAKGLLKGFKKRWFSLHGSKLHYFENKGDPLGRSLGFIDILAASSIVPSFPTPSSSNSTTKGGNCEFQVTLPQRVYSMIASTEQEMRRWVAALDYHRQRLIRQSRHTTGGFQDEASIRRGSVGTAIPGGSSSTSPSSPTSSLPSSSHSSSSVRVPQRQTVALGQNRARRMTSTETAPPQQQQQSQQQQQQQQMSSSSNNNMSSVTRELIGQISMQSASNRRRELASSQTLDDTTVESAMRSGGAGAIANASASVGGAGAELEKRLRMKNAELERDLDERDEMLRELKQEIAKDLRELTDKHRVRDTEMLALRDELTLARRQLEIMAPAHASSASASSSSSSSSSLSSEEEIQSAVATVLEAAGGDRDVALREQQKQIAELQASLALAQQQHQHHHQQKEGEEGDAEDEAERQKRAEEMRERVKLAIEQFKREREAAGGDGPQAMNEQLKKENQMLRDEIRRVVEKMDSMVRQTHQ